YISGSNRWACPPRCIFTPMRPMGLASGRKTPAHLRNGLTGFATGWPIRVLWGMTGWPTPALSRHDPLECSRVAKVGIVNDQLQLRGIQAADDKGCGIAAADEQQLVALDTIVAPGGRPEISIKDGVGLCEPEGIAQVLSYQYIITGVSPATQDGAGVV